MTKTLQVAEHRLQNDFHPSRKVCASRHSTRLRFIVGITIEAQYCSFATHTFCFCYDNAEVRGGGSTHDDFKAWSVIILEPADKTLPQSNHEQEQAGTLCVKDDQSLVIEHFELRQNLPEIPEVVLDRLRLLRP